MDYECSEKIGVSPVRMITINKCIKYKSYRKKYFYVQIHTTHYFFKYLIYSCYCYTVLDENN